MTTRSATDTITLGSSLHTSPASLILLLFVVLQLLVLMVGWLSFHSMHGLCSPCRNAPIFRRQLLTLMTTEYELCTCEKDRQLFSAESPQLQHETCVMNGSTTTCQVFDLPNIDLLTESTANQAISRLAQGYKCWPHLAR
jgi:hypothetical protein